MNKLAVNFLEPPDHTGGLNGHAPNCFCYECTGGDPYLMRVKRSVGKNAYVGLPARVGAYGTRYNHADPAVQTISNPAPAQTVAPASSGGSDWLSLLGQLGQTALGTLMQKQKDGTLSDPTLNKIGQLGNQVAQAGTNAGIAQANSTVGENVIKFSPWIIGGVVLALGTIIYLIARK